MLLVHPKAWNSGINIWLMLSCLLSNMLYLNVVFPFLKINMCHPYYVKLFRQVRVMSYFMFLELCMLVFQVIHFDIQVVPLVFRNSYQYYLHFTNEFSILTLIYFLKEKSDVLQAFINFKSQVELQLNHNIKTLRNDWGGKFQALSANYLSLASHIMFHVLILVNRMLWLREIVSIQQNQIWQ